MQGKFPPQEVEAEVLAGLTPRSLCPGPLMVLVANTLKTHIHISLVPFLFSLLVSVTRVQGAHPLGLVRGA